MIGDLPGAGPARRSAGDPGLGEPNLALHGIFGLRQTRTETSPAIRARAAWTERARREACRRVGQEAHTVAAVAAEFGVGWATVMAAVRDYGLP